MKKIFLLFLLIISSNLYAIEAHYRGISFNIPENKLKSVGEVIAKDSNLAIFGKEDKWFMLISEAHFDRHCQLIAERIKEIPCDIESRKTLFEKLANDEKLLKKFFILPPDWKDHYPDGFKKVDYKTWIAYFFIPKKRTGEVEPHALFIDKLDNHTIYVQGKYTKEHMGWLNIE
jgi:hypothetical protein